MATSVVTLDCEGVCCCRCKGCFGSGYWDSYDVTFPVSDGEIRCILGVPTFVPGATDVISNCISGNTFTIPATYIKFGSEGSEGTCAWGANICPTGGGFFSGQISFSLTDVNTGQMQVSYFGVCVVGLAYNLISFNCRTGGTISGDPTPNVNCLSPCANYPHFATNITITPSAGATWQQCGENSDGTTYTGVVASAPPVMMAFAPSGNGSKVSLPMRATRCESLGPRTEMKAGCSGWLCGHACEKSLPAMPGGYCQTCDFYEPDPDYEPQGVAGWMQ